MRWAPTKNRLACMLAGWHTCMAGHADSLRMTHSSRSFRASRCHAPAQVGKRAHRLAQRRVLQRALLAELHGAGEGGMGGSAGTPTPTQAWPSDPVQQGGGAREACTGDMRWICAGSHLVPAGQPHWLEQQLQACGRGAGRGGAQQVSDACWSAQCRPLGHIASMQARCAWEADRHGMLAAHQPAQERHFTHRWGS